MTRQEDRVEIPDWKCERYLLRELDESEMERIRHRSEHDEVLKARLAQLENSNRELLLRRPPAVMARQIERKLAATQSPAIRGTERRPWRGPRLVWAPVAAAAAVAVLLLFNPGVFTERHFPMRGPIDTQTTRIKGPAAVLSLYRWTRSGSDRLENRDVVAEHDRIRASYHSDGQTYGLILSVDGRGVVTRHHPLQGGPVLFQAGGPHALDFSYELDDAPLWEIFILASAKERFDADAVIDSIESSPLVQTPGIAAADAESVLQSLRMPKNVSLATFTLIKEVGDE